MEPSQLKVNQPTTRERSHPKAPPKRPGANLRGHGTGTLLLVLYRYPLVHLDNPPFHVHHLADAAENNLTVHLTADDAPVTVGTPHICLHLT